MVRPTPRLLRTAAAAVVVAGLALSTAACSTGGSSSGSSASSGGSGATESLVLGSPGIPPVISGMLPYIAEKQGFYKKYGLNVTIKSFATGTDATRAAATGQIDVAIAPPAQVVQLDAQGKQLVGVQGQQYADWVIASTDPSINSCSKLKGQSIGVDAVGGIRYIALLQMLRTCGLDVTKDVHALAFAGNSNAQALVAGQLKVGVLHLNDFYSVEGQGKQLTTAVKMATAVPDTMYEFYATTKSNLAKKRSAFVKLVAAQSDAIKWMMDPANGAKVAQYATVTGGKQADLEKAFTDYRALQFWSTTSDGMPAKNVDNTIQGQVKAGNVTAAKAPKAADIVDGTVYSDAQKLLK
jgi:NitT/TauT family transport system substrate-binding protein